ncbi:unnamed protein product [Mesocestoides corti]|uniref:UBC core domain-containing protein n=1 Tax=Mesocestoides corti TaxID=53468 RepID=A0A158QVY0_MESCO|nr:unnamed protein product [Mesocestoides corti]
MPYILYSSRQDQLRQDWSASMPPVEVPTFRERLHAKKTISADNKQVAELEPPVIPTKCPWVPPCGAPFGSRAPRFPETKIRCTRDGVGPGSYRIMAPIDQELESLAKRTFSFDAFTEPRFAPPKHGYYVRDNANNPPPGSIDVPTLIDLLTFAANRKKGRFLKSVRFPKVYGERCCLSAPGYNIDKEVNAAWGKYNTDLPQAKSCKLKPIKAPFGSHITAKMTQKRYNNSIGIQCFSQMHFRLHLRGQGVMIPTNSKRNRLCVTVASQRLPRDNLTQPNTDYMFWYGIISVRKGQYAGGVFSFNLQIPEDFPCSRSPKIFLPCGFYHPCVNPTTGEVDSSSEFEKWIPGVSRIYHLLYYLRCILSDPAVDLSPPADSSTSHWPDWSKFANPEAACTYVFDFLVTQPDVFENRARSYVENHSLWSSTDSSSLESSSSSSPLSVLGWQNDSFVAMIREKIANSSQPFKNCPCCSDAGCRGYSWIDPDNMTLFSPMRLCNGKPD